MKLLLQITVGIIIGIMLAACGLGFKDTLFWVLLFALNFAVSVMVNLIARE